MFYYIIVYLFTIMENVNIAVGWVTGLSAKVEKSQVEEAVKDVVDDELIDLIAKKVAQSAKKQLAE